jgi:hypothetical protein
MGHLQRRLCTEQRLVLQVADVIVLSRNRSALSSLVTPAVFIPSHLLQQQLRKHNANASWQA